MINNCSKNLKKWKLLLKIPQYRLYAKNELPKHVKALKSNCKENQSLAIIPGVLSDEMRGQVWYGHPN